MKRFTSVDEYILNVTTGKDLLIVLREIIKSTELEETIKWGAPCYTFNGKNVVGLAAFKSYVGMWFYQGGLLKDSRKVLLNAQENKTKALRQWRFEFEEDLNEPLILEYVKEAIENQKQNKSIKPNRSKPIVISAELSEALDADIELRTAFEAFSKGK